MNTRIAEIIVNLYLGENFTQQNPNWVAQMKNPTLKEAEQALLSHFDEVIGGDLGGKFYTTRKLKEIDGLTAVNNFKSELRQKLGIK